MKEAKSTPSWDVDHMQGRGLFCIIVYLFIFIKRAYYNHLFLNIDFVIYIRCFYWLFIVYLFSVSTIYYVRNFIIYCLIFFDTTGVLVS